MHNTAVSIQWGYRLNMDNNKLYHEVHLTFAYKLISMNETSVFLNIRIYVDWYL